jgi:hypothetical protein
MLSNHNYRCIGTGSCVFHNVTEGGNSTNCVQVASMLRIRSDDSPLHNPHGPRGCGNGHTVVRRQDFLDVALDRKSEYPTQVDDLGAAPIAPAG